MDRNARVELDFRDFDGAAVEQRMDLVEPCHDTVIRRLAGRVKLIFTLPGNNVRQAARRPAEVVTFQ